MNVKLVTIKAKIIFSNHHGAGVADVVISTDGYTATVVSDNQLNQDIISLSGHSSYTDKEITQKPIISESNLALNTDESNFYNINVHTPWRTQEFVLNLNRTFIRHLLLFITEVDLPLNSYFYVNDKIANVGTDIVIINILDIKLTDKELNVITKKAINNLISDVFWKEKDMQQ